MRHNAHETYHAERILSADPVELVGLAYRAAIEAVREARRQLKIGDILARGRAITKGSRILIELAANLDRERGGEYAVRLGKLYGYLVEWLSEAHRRKADAPLAEVIQLLNTVAEGWDGLMAQRRAPQEAAANRWAAPMAAEAAAVGQARAWSF